MANIKKRICDRKHRLIMLINGISKNAFKKLQRYLNYFM